MYINNLQMRTTSIKWSPVVHYLDVHIMYTASHNNVHAIANRHHNPVITAELLNKLTSP